MSSFFNAIELPNPGPASEIIPRPGTLVGENGGGIVISQGVGPDITMFNLEYLGLTLAQKEALRVFYLTTVRGGYTTFTYTDKDSVTHTVRWWGGWAIKPDTNSDGASWSGPIVLREEV